MQPPQTIQQPWDVDMTVYPTLSEVQVQEEKSFYLVPGGKEDWQRVIALYNPSKVNGLVVANVEVIFNQAIEASFIAGLKVLENRAGKDSEKAFKAAWLNEGGVKKVTRERVYQSLMRRCDGSLKNFKHIKVVPMFHATKRALLPSILSTNLANLATVDEGYFGKGMYFTSSAEYAETIYGGDRTLLFNWISFFSALPVHYDDDGGIWNSLSAASPSENMVITALAKAKLFGKGNRGNYDAHYALVVPRDPKNPGDKVYFPIKDQQSEKYDELVVFQASQILPRYVVTLAPSGADIKEPVEIKKLRALKEAFHDFQKRPLGPLSLRAAIKKMAERLKGLPDDTPLTGIQHWFLAQLGALNKTQKNDLIESLLLYFHRMEPQDNLDERIIFSVKQWYETKKSVPQLFGPSLPLEQSVTQLIKQSEESSQISVGLDNLFDEASHVLIVGPGAVGKSTLCQTAAYQWSQGRLWKDKFDLLILVPLRELLVFEGDNLYDFFLKQCLGPSATDMCHVEELKEFILNNSERVLFVLDGYDEIAAGLQRGSVQERLLSHLKSYPCWLITSRSYATLEVGAESVYENIGFSTETISRYVYQRFTEKQKAERLLAYFQQRPQLFGVARIPLVLGAICALWNKKEETLAIQTLTDLYQELLLLLTQRMLDRRGVAAAFDYRREDLERSELLRPFLRFLEEIAWKSFEEKRPRISMLTEEYRRLFEQFGGPDETKDLVSFIRESGLFPALTSLQGFLNNDYQFLHASFQEFFAARYLLRLLKENRDLATAMIQKYRFQSRYEDLFAFVSGLLKQDSTLLNFFFEQLDSPVDKIGIASSALQISCLEECWPAEHLKSKQQRLEKLRGWCTFLFNSFHGRAGADYFLNRFARCSQMSQLVLIDEAIKSFPQSTSRSQRQYILSALKIVGKGVPHCVIPILMQLLQGTKEQETVLTTVIELGESAPSIALSEIEKCSINPQLIAAYAKIGKTLAAPKLVEWLDHPDSQIVWASLIALGELPKSAIPKLEQFFANGEVAIRKKVIELAKKVEKQEIRYVVPLLTRAKDAFIEAELKRIQIVEGSLKAVQALTETDREVENEAVVEMVAAITQQERPAVISFLLHLFQSQKRRSQAIFLFSLLEAHERGVIQILLQACFDKRLGVQCEALRALKKLERTENLLVFIKACTDSDPEVQVEALEAIDEVATKREVGMFQEIVSCCSSPHPKVRAKALKAASRFARASDKELVNLGEGLCQDKEAIVQIEACRLLGVIGQAVHEELLLKLYPEASLRVKIEIIKALENMGTAKAVSWLLGECSRSSGSLYQTACRTLAKVGFKAPEVALEGLTQLLIKLQDLPLMQETMQAIGELGKVAPQLALKGLIYCCHFRDLEGMSHLWIHRIGVVHLFEYCRQRKDEVPFLAKFLVQNCFALLNEGESMTVLDPQNGTIFQIRDFDPHSLQKALQDLTQSAAPPLTHFFNRSKYRYLMGQQFIAPARTLSFALATLDPDWIKQAELEECLEKKRAPEKEFDAPLVTLNEEGDLLVKISEVLAKNEKFLRILSHDLHLNLSPILMEKFQKKYLFEFVVKKEQLLHFLQDQLHLDPAVLHEFQR